AGRDRENRCRGDLRRGVRWDGHFAERDLLVAEQAELDALVGGRVAVPLEAGALEVLDLEPVLLDVVGDREAEDGRAVVALPEVAEGAADRVLRLPEIAPARVGGGDRRWTGLAELEAEVAELHLLVGRVLGPVLEAGPLEVLDVVPVHHELAGARVAEDVDAAVGVEVVEERVADA